MFDWLLDNRWTVCLILASAAVILLALWYRTRKRYYAVGVAVVAGLAALFFLIAALRGETDQQQIERKVRELAAAAQAADAEQIARHLAEDFRSPGQKNRETFVADVVAQVRWQQVTEVVVWGFDFKEVSRDQRTAKVRFSAKVKSGNGDFTADVEADFVLESDDEWRLKGFKVFFPPNSTQEFPIRF